MCHGGVPCVTYGWLEASLNAGGSMSQSHGPGMFYTLHNGDCSNGSGYMQHGFQYIRCPIHIMLTWAHPRLDVADWVELIPRDQPLNPAMSD